MKTLLRVVVALVIALAVPGAHAATSVCTSAGDGTPCLGSCITAGVCDKGACRALTVAPNDSPCASGALCSSGDTCKDGVCMPGTTAVCPDLDSCHVGVCNTVLGCGFKNICMPPDLSAPPPDLSSQPDLSTPPDLSSPPDMAPPDLSSQPDLSQPMPDLSQPVPDLSQPMLPDLSSPPDLTSAPDLSSPPDLALSSQIRGSTVFGCTVGGVESSNWSWAFTLLLLAYRSRRRR